MLGYPKTTFRTAIPAATAVALTLAFLIPSAASAITVNGVDFDSPLVIDIGPATHLEVTTTEDVYVYVPNGLFVDSLALTAFQAFFDADTTVDVNDPLLCASGCPLEFYDLTEDVLLRIFDPIGDFAITSSGTVIVSGAPIPEPASYLLVAAGLACLGVRQKGVGSASAS
jgi:hypothetical protein